MKTVPLAKAKNELSALVDEIVSTQQAVTITRNGVPAVVVLAVEDYESIMETLDLAGDPDAMADIRQARDDATRGETFTLEQVLAELIERDRNPGAA